MVKGRTKWNLRREGREGQQDRRRIRLGNLKLKQGIETELEAGFR